MSPLLWPQCPVKLWAATSKPQLIRTSSCQRPWWICTAIPQAQASRSSPSSGCRESWSQDSICVPAHKGRGGGVQRRQKPNSQTAGGSEQSLVGKAGTAPGMGTVQELQQQLTLGVRGSSPSRLISMNVITPPLLLPSSRPPGGGEALLAFAHRLCLLSSSP